MSPILALLLLIGSIILNIAGTIVLIKMFISLQKQSEMKGKETTKKH